MTAPHIEARKRQEERQRRAETEWNGREDVAAWPILDAAEADVTLLCDALERYEGTKYDDLRKRAKGFMEAWGADGQWIQPETVIGLLDRLERAEKVIGAARHGSHNHRYVEDPATGEQVYVPCAQCDALAAYDAPIAAQEKP